MATSLAVLLLPSEMRSSDQAEFQAKIVDDRKQLFAGRLNYSSRLSVPVGDSATYPIRLTALGEGSSARPTPEPAAETRAFQVGGVQGASLTSASSHVRVVRLHDTTARQVIAAPQDTADWNWSITATEPGSYDLVLNLTTYQKDSNRALHTLKPPITVHLQVESTWSHRIASMQDWLIALGSVAAALLALYAFRTPLTELARARREARHERSRGSRDGYL
ncbi:hypothetical protein [Streptomyces chartreusis]|uniref:hypothetical protein n=1 Tax=Streptomyces chartreusis TaxID=1969 RepID=UPI0037FAC735